MLRVIYVVSIVCIIGLVLGQQQQSQQCWNHFVTTFTGCCQNNSINHQHLLYLTRNQTGENAPPDIDAFKIQACNKEANIFNCTLSVRNVLLNNSICTQPEKTTINTFFNTVFQPYDQICAHPCRFTMIDSLRACYSKAKLDPGRFMPNTTQMHGGMLGDKPKDVDTFCTAKGPLVDCMKREQMNCPESAIVMSNIRLDLNTMETTVNVLCSHPKVYLDTEKCFSSPSMDVGRCVALQAKDVYDLGMEAQNTKMAQTEFLKRFCALRIKNLQCDLGAWRNHTVDTCNKAVIGMKTELDCKLIPEECRMAEKSNYDKICDKSNFETTHRDVYKAGGLSVCPSIFPSMLPIILYFLYN